MIVGRKYRLDLTPEQEARALEIADVCRAVWNVALEQRRQYRRRGAWVSFYDQSKQLTELRAAEPWVASAPRDSVGHALRELDRACKRHGTWRVRWKSRRDNRRAFTCRSKRYIRAERINARWGRVRVEGMGWMKFRMTRDIGGEIRNATVSRVGGRWYVSIQLEDGLVESKPSGPPVGVDRGVAVAVATSDGQFFDRQFATEGERKHIVRLQQRLARQRKGSNRRAATRRKLQRANERLADRRKDFTVKCARTLATNYGLIAVEDLKVKNMTARGRGKRGLNRSILDKGWGQFKTDLEHMGRRHGARIVFINPAYTSQTCADCGHVAKESRESQTRFCCVSCGHTANADTNAAQNIMAAGIAVTARGDFADVGRSMKRELTERKTS